MVSWRMRFTYLSLRDISQSAEKKDVACHTNSSAAIPDRSAPLFILDPPPSSSLFLCMREDRREAKKEEGDFGRKKRETDSGFYPWAQPLLSAGSEFTIIVASHFRGQRLSPYILSLLRRYTNSYPSFLFGFCVLFWRTVGLSQTPPFFPPPRVGWVGSRDCGRGA